ncbi:hypothetical protein AAG570_010786 [Ranatra chinensis]|uniref:glutathione transferase n=1 Tax=Ranatra chinensis TaxID=642074 RepID=A0ABD0YNI9_9HEMI
MDPIRFYYDNLSQPCRALEIFLKVNKIPFEGKFVHLSSGDHLTDTYRKINPFKKVPVIDDNGFLLTESVAILRYLCREKDVPDHWYPKDSRRQARVDEYLEWQHIETRAQCSLYFRAKFLDPLLTGKAAKSLRVSNYKRRMEKVCDQIESVWLKGKLFIAGDQISIADLLAATELEQLRPTLYDPTIGRPLMAGWMERVKRATTPHYEEVHSRIYKLAERVFKEETLSLAKL